MEDNKLEGVQKNGKIEEIQENKMDNVSGGKFDDEPVLVCYVCGKKFPVDKVVICPGGSSCCNECRMKGKK